MFEAFTHVCFQTPVLDLYREHAAPTRMGALDKLEADLAHTIRRLYERGLVSGVGGNASVLLPSRKEILITPAGYFKGGVAEGDLVRVSLQGKVTGRGRPSSELATHLEAYRVRKDVRAVVHGHPPTAVALVTAGITIPPMTPEHAALIRSLEVVDFALPGERGARAVARQLRKCDLVGIRNHGFFSLGSNLHEAASRLEVLEESAKIYLTMRQIGRISTLDEDDAEKIRDSYGRE
jgi:L-fuculose-phosphate aldolase